MVKRSRSKTQNQSIDVDGVGSEIGAFKKLRSSCSEIAVQVQFICWSTYAYFDLLIVALLCSLWQYVDQASNVEPKLIIIHVQTLNGQLPPIIISAEATVRDLKLRVQAMNAAFAFDQQKLLIHQPDDADSGMVLLNRRTLQSYQITESTNVALVILPSLDVEVCIDAALKDPYRFKTLLENRDLHATAIAAGSAFSHRPQLFQLFDENRSIRSIRISGRLTDEYFPLCEALMALRPDIDIKCFFDGRA
jgi:hypothetical protein